LNVQTEQAKHRQSERQQQRCSDVGNPFHLLSLPLNRHRDSLKRLGKHHTNLKTCTATPRQALQRLTFPGGRSCDPMTHVLSKISCFLQRRPHSVSNSTTYRLPREWTGTETACDGGLCPFNDPPTPLLSPILSHTPFNSFPFPLPVCLGIAVRLGARMRVVLLLLVCLNGSGMTLRRASNLHKNSNPPLTKTDPAHFSHLYSRAPPTSHTFPTELRPPTGYYCQPLLLE